MLALPQLYIGQNYSSPCVNGMERRVVQNIIDNSDIMVDLSRIILNNHELNLYLFTYAVLCRPNGSDSPDSEDSDRTSHLQEIADEVNGPRDDTMTDL